MNNRFLIILFLIIALVIFSILLKNKKLKGSVFISILYVLITGVVLSTGGLLELEDLIPFSLQAKFILLGVWMCLIGTLHTMLMKEALPWVTKKVYWTGFFFSLIIVFTGAIFILLVYHYIHFEIFIGIHLTSFFLFIAPYLVNGILTRYMGIPIRIFRKWHYPVDRHIEDPLDREMESPLVVGFEFKKRNNDKNMTTFRAKAPKEMVFGKLFYYFINDYNDRNPDEKIEYLDEKEKPVGWIFYFKPTWFSKIRHIDPEETNSFNFIRENSVIICKRVTEK